MNPSCPELPRDHPLAGCEQKLWRAHQHLERLVRDVKGLGDGELQPATFRTEQKPNAKHTAWTVVETVNDPPIRLATLIGDIVHNLRSSLDYLVFELAFLGVRGTRIPERTAFPVSLTQANWRDGYVQNVMLDGVMQKHRALLYRAQPCYRRKDNPTSATRRRRERHAAADLHSLWNEDKHRMIQLAVLAPYIVRPTITVENCEVRGEARINPDFVGSPLEVGAEVLSVPVRPTGPNPKVNVNFQFAFQVCLPDGFPVGLALMNIGEWVTNVLQFFQPVFETPRARRLWELPRGRGIKREPLYRRRPSRPEWELVDGHPPPPLA